LVRVVYHFSGHKDYGYTKEGAYMCEKDALGQGIRAAIRMLFDWLVTGGILGKPGLGTGKVTRPYPH
jgi:hypothetical protein